MTIGTNLFARLSTEGFARTQSQITELQGQIASGKNDPAPSSDPVRALRLSAAQDQQDRVGRFTANAQAAAERLGQADVALADASAMVLKLKEISVNAANGTLTAEGAAALRTTVLEIRSALVDAANQRDSAGQPLFSGYGGGLPFSEGPDGVSYSGDGGRTALQLSETLTLHTALNGGEVFGTSTRGLFAAVDDLAASLLPETRAARHAVTAEGSAEISLPRSANRADVSFRLSGPSGEAEISARVAGDLPGPLAEAINAVSAQTGVTATLSADGQTIQLAAQGSFTIAGASRSDEPRAAVLSMALPAANGRPASTVTLGADRVSKDSVLETLDRAVGAMVSHRAEAGALARAADDQIAALGDRALRLDHALSALEDLDIAEAVTKLQTLLMTQEASQQTFVRIRSTGLFDYLR